MSRETSPPRKYKNFSHLPRKQQTSPGKTGPETGQKNQISLFNCFIFSSFRETDGNGGSSRVCEPVNINSHPGGVKFHPIHRRLDDPQVRLMGYVKPDSLGVYAMFYKNFMRDVGHAA